MNNDQYLQGVLVRHQSAGNMTVAQTVANNLSAPINAWANGFLDGMYISGSVAKGTAISGTSDVDILVLLIPGTPENLQQVYETLHTALTNSGHRPVRQNVSLGLQVGAIKVDVVPSKRQSLQTNDHSLWSHKKSTWRQTNIHRHVQLISQSGRVDDIKLIKIWRKLHNLDFPSFLLEMTVLQALRGSTYSLANNFVTVLEYIRDTLPKARILDPSNTNNAVTDELNQQEKQLLANAAARSLSSNWNQVVW
jgi:predicted nucleotidyltransferase